MRYIRQALTPAQMARLEHMSRQICELEAKTDYLSMITDAEEDENDEQV